VEDGVVQLLLLEEHGAVRALDARQARAHRLLHHRGQLLAEPGEEPGVHLGGRLHDVPLLGRELGHEPRLGEEHPLVPALLRRAVRHHPGRALCHALCVARVLPRQPLRVRPLLVPPPELLRPRPLVHHTRRVPDRVPVDALFVRRFSADGREEEEQHEGPPRYSCGQSNVRATRSAPDES
jgi:hypothetical protein